MRIVIVGAGVAGCIVARTLSRRTGAEVVCLERVGASEHGESGTGLNIGPNGVKALRNHDPALVEAIAQASFPRRAWKVSLTDGTVLFDLPLAEVADNDGWRIRWSELYRVLRDAAAPAVAYGCTVTHMAPCECDAARTCIAWTQDGVEKRLDDVDLLIAADGRYSQVRWTISGTHAVRHVGVAISRVLVPDTSGGLIDDYEQWFNGPNRLLGFRVPPAHVYATCAFPIAPEEAVPPTDWRELPRFPASGDACGRTSRRIASLSHILRGLHRGSVMVTRRHFLGSMTARGTSALVPSEAVALQDGEPSRTAQSAALHRAAHQLLDVPVVLADPSALEIIGPERRRLLESSLDRYRQPGPRAMRAFIVARSRYAEDELALAASQGTSQYVVLGAGLDTFAYRNPRAGSLRVFEVDHPSTQGWKQKKLQEQGIDVPGSLSFVAVDFEKDSLAERLPPSGFNAFAPAFISWLGVTMYLEREAVLQTLRFVAQTCARGSQIVFDFSLPDDLLPEAQRIRREERAHKVARIGEPWISHFEPTALTNDLLAMGFSIAAATAPREINQLYFAARSDGLRVIGSSVNIMNARV